MRCHLIPSLGARPLQRLTPAQIQSYLHDKRCSGGLAGGRPGVIDRILAHIRETGGRDPFDERGPLEGKAIGVGAGAA